MNVNNGYYKISIVPKRDSDSVVTFTMPKELRQALEKLAEDEERSFSFLVRKAVEKDLREKGYLASDAQRRSDQRQLDFPSDDN